jgi:hypothetical protein
MHDVHMASGGTQAEVGCEVSRHIVSTSQPLGSCAVTSEKKVGPLKRYNPDTERTHNLVSIDQKAPTVLEAKLKM